MFRLWESRIPFLGQWTRIRRGHRQAGRVRRSRRWRRLHRGLGGECRRGQVAGPVANPVLAIPGETIVQVHAIGPWGLTYVNPKDDPRNK
jgi:hypothetical protein